MSAPQKDHPTELSSLEIFWTKHQNKRNIEIKRHHEINDDHSCLPKDTQCTMHHNSDEEGDE